MRKNESNSLTEGPIWKGLLKFALPILVGQIFQQLYNTADAYIVGKFLDKNAYAAVSSSGSLVFLLVGFFSGIAIGGGVVISRYYGAKDDEMVHKAVHTTVAFGLVAGLVLTFVGVFLTPQILKLMDTPPEVMENSVMYFQMYFAGVMAIVVYNLCAGILRAVGDSRHPLYYLIISSIINVGLDILFMGVFEWKVWSAAFATTIAQFISMILCLIRLIRHKSVYQLQPRKLRFHRSLLAQVIKNGLPSGIQNSIIALANVVVQSNINDFQADAIAGCGSFAKLEGFAFLPITCFTMALTTFVGQNLGAKQYERTRKGARFGILCSIILAEIIGIIMFLIPEPLVGFFQDDPNVIAYGAKQARVQALFFFVLAYSHAIAGILRGAGKPMVPMIVMLGSWCALRVGFISLFVPIFERIEVVFTAYPLTWSVSSIVFLIYYLKSDWLHSYARTGKAEIADP